MLKRLLLLLSLVFPLSLLQAELQNENLLQAMPAGYKVDYQNRQGKIMMIEMVPEKESVQDWSHMVTTTIAYGGINTSLKEYYKKVKHLWESACVGSDAMILDDGETNGYDYLMWGLECKQNRSTKKSELTYFKMIQGKDSTYIIQKSWRDLEPKQEESDSWIAYLASVTVCDSRDDDHPCPK